MFLKFWKNQNFIVTFFIIIFKYIDVEHRKRDYCI